MWAAELLIRISAIFVLQVFVGLAAFLISRVRTSPAIQYALLSLVLVLNCWLSLAASDLQTFLQSVVVAGLTSAFITPLRAFAHVFRASIDRNYAVTADPFSTVVRIAVPAADASPIFRLKQQQRSSSDVDHRNGQRGSKTDAGEPPGMQVMRALVLLTISSTCKQFWPIAKARGGLYVDTIAAITVWAGTSGVLNLTSAIRAVLLGEQSGAPFNAPFISPSQAAFWSYRWNAPISDALRGAVYEPLTYSGFSRSFSVMSCFYVSGLAHQVVLHFLQVRNSRNEWFLFFILAGIAVLVEQAIPVFKMCPILRRVCGTLILGYLFHAFFVPCLVRSGFADKAIDALAAGPDFLSALFHRAFPGRVV